MVEKAVRIGVVAPSSPFERETAERVQALALRPYPHGELELVFHPQCFETHNHFAGTDESRAEAFLDYANDPSFDALWGARGGYGACRIAHMVLDKLEPAAKAKTYLGYSDFGTLLAGLYKAGCSVAHGPMCQDVVRDGGEAAIKRALRYLAERRADTLEPDLDRQHPNTAFNMIVLSQLLGTELEPDLGGHNLILEEVSEYAYRIDRTMHHITANTGIRKVAGIRLGRCSDIPENDVEFGMNAEEIVRHWCEVADIPFLGRADIGHDTENKIVPFGIPKG